MNETNMILKNVLINLRTNALNNHEKNKLIELLKVDIQNVQPIDITNSEIPKRNDDKKSIFLYIDKAYRIIGILEGSQNPKQWQSFSSSYYNKDWGTIKISSINRKNMLPIANTVLMITPEMRTYKPKKNIICRTRSNRQLLNDRLERYKRSKYENISYQQILFMARDILNYLTINIVIDDNKEILEKMKPINNYRRDCIEELIRDFADIIKDYKRQYESYLKMKNRYGDDPDYSDYCLSEKCIADQSKVVIVKWNQTIHDINILQIGA